LQLKSDISDRLLKYIIFLGNFFKNILVPVIKLASWYVLEDPTPY